MVSSAHVVPASRMQTAANVVMRILPVCLEEQTAPSPLALGCEIQSVPKEAIAIGCRAPVWSKRLSMDNLVQPECHIHREACKAYVGQVHANVDESTARCGETPNTR